jgi:lysophospholipase L1-like esterase
MRVVLGFFVCVFSLMWVSATEVGAEWGSETPKLHYQKETSFRWTPYCPTYYQEEKVLGIEGLTRMCQFGGHPMRIGLSYPDNGQIRLLAAYPYDDTMRIVQGICGGIRNCLYAPQSDTIVSRYPASNRMSVKIYRNVSDRIRSIFNASGVSYTFDTSQPDFTFADSEGRELPVEAVAVSNNGKWIAIEYRQYGIILINQETFEMQRILAQGFRYGSSVDPTVELAVSNDGTMIAVMGERAGFTVAIVNAECGDRVRVGMRELFRGDVKHCEGVKIDASSYIAQYHGAYDPRFSDSGQRLDFVVTSKTGAAKRIGVGVDDSTSGVLEYVALGDSFTSGEGETDNGYYVSRTDNEFEKCHISRRSYPFLFAGLIGLSSARNVACSGAKMTDISAVRGVYWGQGGRMGVSGLGYSENHLQIERANALASFHPGVVPQIEFVERYMPQLITVGVGGNDAGITTKLRVCAMQYECEWTSEEGRRKTANEIQSLFPQFVELFEKLAILSPLSRIIAVGYPLGVDTEGVCDPITTLLFNRQEQVFMNESVRYLNQVIEWAAAAAKLKFADMSQVFSGHQLCASTLLPAMNGLRLGDDTGVGDFRAIGNESFHPTPYGHELIAHELKRQYPLLVADGNCSYCPTGSPLWPEYWGSDSDEVKSRIGEFAWPTRFTSLNQAVSIHLPAAHLLPGSTIEIEVHSEPTELGTAIVNDDGSVDETVTLPEGLAEGVHTIHLLGASFSGDPVELYQEIVYERARVDEDKVESDSPPSGEAARGEKLSGNKLEDSGTAGVLVSHSIASTSFKSRGESVLGATTNHAKSSRQTAPIPWILIVAGIILGCGTVGYVIFRRARDRGS